MPLPENWNGIFYAADSGAALLFDLEPAAFRDHPSVAADPNPAFLFAGGHCDLLLNGYHERAASFLALAKQTWPEKPWAPYEQLLAIIVLAEGGVPHNEIKRKFIYVFVRAKFSDEQGDIIIEI